MRKMVDMALTDDEQAEGLMLPSVASATKYPPGLSVCFTDRELGKLGLPDDVEVGDLLDFRAMMVVTNVNKSQSSEGKKSCRVEGQITSIMELENESTE